MENVELNILKGNTGLSDVLMSGVHLTLVFDYQVRVSFSCYMEEPTTN